MLDLTYYYCRLLTCLLQHKGQSLATRLVVVEGYKLT